MIDPPELLAKIKEAGRREVADFKPQGNTGKSWVTIDIKPIRGSFVSYLKTLGIGGKSRNGMFWQVPVDAVFDESVLELSGYQRRTYADAAAKELRRREINARGTLVMP